MKDESLPLPGIQNTAIASRLLRAYPHTPFILQRLVTLKFINLKCNLMVITIINQATGQSMLEAIVLFVTFALLIQHLIC
jgi:hypothetical protein